MSGPIILQAAEEGDWDIVKCLKDLGEDIGAVDENGRGLTQETIGKNDVGMVECLFSLESTIGYRRVCWMEFSGGDKEDELIAKNATLLHSACESPDTKGLTIFETETI